MHVDKIKKENKNDDMKKGNHNYDSDGSYNSNSDGSEESGEESGEDEDGLIALKRKQSVLFNVDDLSAMMRRGTVAMNEYTSNRIQRLYREQVCNVLRLFSKFSNFFSNSNTNLFNFSNLSIFIGSSYRRIRTLR